ncbi:MAG: YceD family protein [Qingshengfaniella sp.]
MTDPIPSTAPTPSSPDHLLRLSGRRADATARVTWAPDKTQTADLCAALDLLGLSKVSFDGALRPAGHRGWDLTGQFGATVIQPCAITSAPVRTRIGGKVLRCYRQDLDEPAAGSEIEMPEDDSLEPLGASINLLELLQEEITLALPLFPRAAGAEMGQAQFAAPGVTPMRDEDTRPFAALSGLRAALGDGTEDTED